MRISNKQKRAIEKISGKRWDTFSLKGIESYFAWTDRGEVIPCDDPDFYLLMEYHRQHPVIVEMWKADFKSGLLFLWDFLLPELPPSHIKHTFEIYEGVFHYVPSCYRNHSLSPYYTGVKGRVLTRLRGMV